MELVSSLKPRGLSPSDCARDPKEKELSDEDVDDRNHKHRRREAQSQSLERENLEPVFGRPYRKRNKPFENGYLFKGNESQASDSWRTNNNNQYLEKDFVGKFDKRRQGLTPQLRGTMELNQRIWGNQTYSGDPGPGRGRGWDSGIWNQDSRFNDVDIASQMVHQGAQGTPWSAFGLVLGMGLDTLHPMGLQEIRPPLISSLNMAIPRERCRDFEERGFCLRGDMCPMEHGVNRIVIEDVQSLSQFNLPVSLTSTQLVGPPAGPGPLSNTIMNSKGAHSKNNKSSVTDDGLGLNGAYSSAPNVDASDFYDPDQPLWNNNCPETSKIGQDESILELSDCADDKDAFKSQGTILPVWSRNNGSHNRVDIKEKNYSTRISSYYLGNENREDQGASEGTLNQGKQTFAKDAGAKVMDTFSKKQGDSMFHTQKPSLKASRTLFVSGIPQNINKRESLFSHFQKFGEVVEIYIPSNTERAFVQFSKREEAEAALMAPNAVMGNRFIKLWWANRDCIPDDGVSTSGNGIANKGKDNVHSSAAKGNVISTPASDHPKPVVVTNGPKAIPITQKKLENLELLKEELRKKQEMLAQKQNDFRRKLDQLKEKQPVVVTNGPKAIPITQKKLENLELLKEELRKKQEMLAQKQNDFRRKLDQLKEKQAIGVKGEAVAEQAGKRLKTVADNVERAAPTCMASPGAELKSVENIVAHSPKISTAVVLQPESTGSKRPIGPVAATGPSFLMNRYKLDNRPTAFRVSPPLLAALANITALKEHFSAYGELSNVEIEETEASCDLVGSDSEAMRNSSACITFTTRRSAEKAFTNGKLCQGSKLKFVWLMPSSSSSRGRENSIVRPAEHSASTGSKEDAVSENGEPESSESKGDIETQEEVCKPCTILESSKKGSSSPEGSG